MSSNIPSFNFNSNEVYPHPVESDSVDFDDFDMGDTDELKETTTVANQPTVARLEGNIEEKIFGKNCVLYVLENPDTALQTGSAEARAFDPNNSHHIRSANDGLAFAEFENEDGTHEIAANPRVAELFPRLASINFLDQNGVRTRTLSTDEVTIREFTPREMTLLSNYFMAPFAAAEARKRLEEERKRKEEEKKLAQEQLDKALKHHHHPKNQPVAKPVKESVNTDATNSKKNGTQFSSSVLRDQQDSVKKTKS